MRAEVVSVILCDDVRKEITGKDILIGVYTGTMNVPTYPATFPAALWVEIEPDGVGQIPGRVKIETPSGNPPIEFGFELEIVEQDTAIFVMGGLPLTVERDGEIVVSIKMGDGDMKVVRRKRVIRTQAPAWPQMTPVAASPVSS